MNDISKRINELANHYGLKSYSSFSKKTGLSHQTASNYMKGKQKPDAEKLALIKQSFDEINSEWLLTGEGNMLLPEENTIKEPKSHWEKKYYALLDKYIEKQDKELQEAKETISVLEAKEFKKTAPSSYESGASEEKGANN